MIPSHTSGVVPLSMMRGDSVDETLRLCSDHRKARHFLLSQKWCIGLGETYFGVGLGNVVAVFLMEIDPRPAGIDQWLWVIVGDIPSGYVVLDRCPTPIAALQVYTALLQEWVDLARLGESSNEVVPINIPVTPENAEVLGLRLASLRSDIIPWLQEGPAIQ